MEVSVTRTFDVLELIRKKYQRKDAIGGFVNGKTYCYSTEEYYQKSRDFALGLIALGFEKGDKIATITNNRPEWNFADMGMAMAGVVHVPIYPTIGIDDYQYILNHSDVRVLIVESKKLYNLIEKVSESTPNIEKIYTFKAHDNLSFYEEIINLGASKRDELNDELNKRKENISTEDLATIIYTSGTTGISKGVMLSHKNLVANFTAHSKVHELGFGHTAISFLPLCHVYERSVNYHFQYKGIGVYYIGNLSEILTALKVIKPDIFNSVPRFLEKVYNKLASSANDLKGIKKSIYLWAFELTKQYKDDRKYGWLLQQKIKLADKLIYSKWRQALGGNLKYIVSGGASLEPTIARVFNMAKITIIEGYGLTETSPVIAVGNAVKNELRVGTVGPILEGIEVKIAEDGEVLTRSDSVMIGYYKNQEQTDEVLEKDGWFHTGDIGVLEEGKYLKITDRKKEIFKLSGGKYISPQTIENKLKTAEFIEQTMVIGANKKFASAIISPSFNAIYNWCKKNGIEYTDKEELINLPQVVSAINSDVKKINTTLGSHEQINRVKIIVDEWSPETGELSPTLKLKRKAVGSKYQELIDDIYTQ